MKRIILKHALALLKENRVEFIFHGDDSIILNKPYPINDLDNYGLSFFRGEDVSNFVHLFNKTNTVLLSNTCKTILPEGNYVFSDNPTLCFNIVGWLFKTHKKVEIHPLAFIKKNAKVGKNVSIGAFSYIGEDVVLSDNVVIEQGCVIENATIGSNVRIQAGVKIGNDNLGFVKNKFNRWQDFPQFGRVNIDDNVIVMDNTVISRGALTDTIIKMDSRIGPNCCIGRGVEISESCILGQSVILNGSVQLGPNTTIWGNASIRNGIKIGSKVIVGMGSVVTKNIPDNEVWVGNPAKRLKDND